MRYKIVPFNYAAISSMVMAVLFVLAGYGQSIDGYHITSHIDPKPCQMCSIKEVTRRKRGAWMANYHQYPLAWAFLHLVSSCRFVTAILLKARKTLTAFIASSIAVLSVIMTAGGVISVYHAIRLATRSKLDGLGQCIESSHLDDYVGCRGGVITDDCRLHQLGI